MGAPDYVQKRSPFQKAVARYERQQARVKATTKKTRERIEARSRLREQCFERDKGRCRATGKALRFQASNPYLVGHAHHIVWLGRGGEDTLSNLILVDPLIHELIHARVVNASRRIDVTGDGNGTVHFSEIDLETGKTTREWDSANPSA
jgi:hypothetical protein